MDIYFKPKCKFNVNSIYAESLFYIIHISKKLWGIRTTSDGIVYA